jgi:hypothetical protein
MDQTLVAELSQCRLEVRIKRIDAASLELCYTLQNQAQQNAYFFNLLYDGINEQGVYKTDRNLVYVEFKDSQVTLSKKIIPVPADIEVEKPVLPCTTLVRPAQRFEENITIRLPLRPWTPYFKPGDAALKATPVLRQVWFEIGFFVAPKQSDSLAKTVQTTNGPSLYFYPFPVSGQRLLRVGPLPSALPVLVPE